MRSPGPWRDVLERPDPVFGLRPTWAVLAALGLVAIWAWTRPGAGRRSRNPRWIQGAIRRPGAFAAGARRAGMTTHAYARATRHAPGRLGRQARLALTLEALRRRR